MQDRKYGIILANEGHDNFNLDRHLLEKDADEFSTLFLASHIIQYAGRLFENIDQFIITKLISLFLIPILTDSISVYPEDMD